MKISPLVEKKRKVLIVTYYWPPAGGPGVQRVLKFVKYLPQFGWEPIVLTISNGEYPAKDESLVDEIPEGTKVYYTESFSPLTIYKKIMGIKGNIPTHVLSKKKNESPLKKLFKWVRVNLYIPDGRRDWISVIVNEGKKVVEAEQPDLIFSSSPPHSVQVGAMRLAQKTGVKWVADMRDPWTDGFWLKGLPRTSWAKAWDDRLERMVLSRADAVTTIGDSLKEMFEQKASNTYLVLPNGFDEQDFSSVLAVPSETFRIIYAGSLRESQMPWRFFRDLQELVDAGMVPKLEIHFYGTVHPDALSYIEELGLLERVTMHGYVPHSDLVGCLCNADILLLLIPDTPDNKGILTGKLFEYMAARRFILGFGPTDGEAADIIQKYDLGRMSEYEDDSKELILQEYKRWETGEKRCNMSDIKNYSRQSLTKELASLMNDLVSS